MNLKEIRMITSLNFDEIFDTSRLFEKTQKQI